MAKSLPLAAAIMVMIVVALFNSIRTTLLVWLIVPLAIIGVTGGLLLTGQPFGFMALLGVLSLGGEQIKNSIVVLSKIRHEVAQGTQPYQAILDGCVSKVRPVLMVAITTVLGMIPLLKDPFFGAMAVCIMFGLSFACILTMIVMPASIRSFMAFPRNLRSSQLQLAMPEKTAPADARIGDRTNSQHESGNRLTKSCSVDAIGLEVPTAPHHK